MAVFARIVLAYVVALPFFVGLTASRSGTYELGVTLSSTAPGVLQIFFDTGQDFSEQQSERTFLIAGNQPREYRLPIQPGQYRRIRIDPGTLPGRYTVHGVVIRRIDGSVQLAISPSSLTPNNQLAIVAQAGDRLVVEASVGGADPQLLYAPVTPIDLPVPQRILGDTLWRLAGIWLIALLAVVFLEWVFGRHSLLAVRVLNLIRETARARSLGAIVAASLLGTIVSTYPVLFFGRSFVSPNNGGLSVLYDAIPGVPFSRDVEVEDTRGSDVSAALYAFVPYSNIQREALWRGEWPLWNPYNAGGRPLWGQGQTFLLDPLHWLTLVTPDPALGWDLKFVVHRFVFAAGIGCAAFVAIGGWVPAAVVAFAAPFVGVYTFRVNHPAVFAMTYMPWALLAWLMLARATTPIARARAALLLSVANALILVASPPKEAIAVILGASGAGALTVLLATERWSERARNIVTAVAAGIVSVLLTAPHWIVFLDTLRESVTNYDNPYAQVGGLLHLVALVVGPLAPGPVLPGAHALVLVTLVAAVCAPRRLWLSHAALACTLVAMVFLVIAFGVVPERWLLSIPFIANIGHLHDVFITAAVPLMLVASAAGIRVLRDAGRLRQIAITVTLLFAALACGRLVAGRAPQNGFEPWAATFVLLAAAMLPMCLRRQAGAHALPVWAASGVIGILLLPGGTHLHSGVETLDKLLMQPRVRVRLDANSPAIESLHRLQTEPTRVVGTEWTLLAGTQALYEIEGLGGPDALFLSHYNELVDAAGIWRGNWVTRVGVHDVERLAPLLDMLNTGFLLTAKDMVLPGFTDVGGDDSLRIGRRRSAWPRAFFVDGVVAYHQPAELLRQAAETGQPFAAISPRDRAAVDETRELMRPASHVVPARGYQVSVNSTAFIVRATGPGVAVLTETFVPNDFVVSVNGRPARCFRVNHAFKGVIIPSAGDWEVAFEYRPARWRVSWILAGIAVVALALLARYAAAP